VVQILLSQAGFDKLTMTFTMDIASIIPFREDTNRGGVASFGNKDLQNFFVYWQFRKFIGSR
jgi:hypothetical protein